MFWRIISHYKLFEPWPQPIMSVQLDPNLTARPAEPQPGEVIGRVAGAQRLDVRLQEIAEAQTWCGEETGVLWECYYLTAHRRPGWEDELAAFWQAVERDMGVARVLTQPREPAFEEGYPDFLGGLGYGPDEECPGWWSKRR